MAVELSCSCTCSPISSHLLPSKLSSSISVFFANRRPKPLSVQRSSGIISTPRRRLGCRCLFGLGVPELVVIAGVAALVFGPKQLPEIGRSIGKTVKSFQQAAKEFESELKKEPEDASKPSSFGEGPETICNRQEKEELRNSGTKENV